MNRDTLTALAREAGFVTDEADFITAPKTGRIGIQLELERFAALVEEHTRKSTEGEYQYLKHSAALWRNEAYKQGGAALPWDADVVLAKAVAAEREACAKYLESREDGVWANTCAAAIRSRT